MTVGKILGVTDRQTNIQPTEISVGVPLHLMSHTKWTLISQASVKTIFDILSDVHNMLHPKLKPLCRDLFTE